MIKVSVVGIISALTLCGFSEGAERDLAQCKLKAIELYRPPAAVGEWKPEPLMYVHTCMVGCPGPSRRDAGTKLTCQHCAVTIP